MSLADEAKTERELLLLLMERVTALNEKFDELRSENLNKYEYLQNEFKTFQKEYQDRICKIDDKIATKSDDFNKTLNMQRGAIGLIYLIATLAAIGMFVLELIN